MTGCGWWRGLFVAAMSVALAACGGGSGVSSAGAPSADATIPAASLTVEGGPQRANQLGSASLSDQRARLISKLYAHNTAKLSYWPSEAELPSSYAYLTPWLNAMPMRGAAAAVGIYSVSYDRVTLPQIVVKLSRPGNRRALVYHQGHTPPDWWPNFAVEVLTTALSEGYDVFIPSMPLFGFNTAAPLRSYAMDVRGPEGLTPIADEVLTAMPHGMMELVDDPDHYMHYHVDGILFPVTANQDVLAQAARPGIVPAVQSYDEVNYLGLSGGGMAGLVGCAIERFDRCMLVAGFLPEVYRIAALDNLGDQEQITGSFWDSFNTDTLLQLARDRNPRLAMFYNRSDPCCFADPSASAFAAAYSDYDIRVTDLATHGFEPAAILAELRR